MSEEMYDDPPHACLSVVEIFGARFACGSVPGHADRDNHYFRADGRGTLPKIDITWSDEDATTASEPPMLALYREALERLADEDTPVLGEGFGGGAQEELHVRASFAAHTLGRDTCGCTECHVSLGLEPEATL